MSTSPSLTSPTSRLSLLKDVADFYKINVDELKNRNYVRESYIAYKTYIIMAPEFMDLALLHLFEYIYNDDNADFLFDDEVVLQMTPPQSPTI